MIVGEREVLSVDEFDIPEVIRSYERGRPAYPAETIHAIIEEHKKLLENSSELGLSVVDAGTGTGLLSASIIAADVSEVSAIYAFDRLNMVRAAKANPALAESITNGMLEISPASFRSSGLQDNSVDLYLSAQALHWGLKDINEYSLTFTEITRVLKDQGSVFAIYNTPVARDSSCFTVDLNRLLEMYCPNRYYQALTSGSLGVFLQDSGSNLGRFFFELVQKRNGRFVFRKLHNPTNYSDYDTVKAYVFSNAFVNNVIREDSLEGGDLEERIDRELRGLYEKWRGDDGMVQYGNDTWIFGVCGVRK